MGTVVSTLGVWLSADRHANRRDHRVHVRPRVDPHGGRAAADRPSRV